MNIYHGGLTVVKKPRIIISERTLDFGPGFYTTTSHKQAVDWTRIKAGRINGTSGAVSTYNIPNNYQELSDFQIKTFRGASEEWLQFVLDNRLNKDFTHNYDIVYGPVANDRVYACLNAFENKFMTFEAAIQELRTYKLADQISFHTGQSLELITYQSYEEIFIHK